MNELARRAWLVFLPLGAGALLAAPIMLLGNPPEPPSAEQATLVTRPRGASGA